jgi:hypothetical protein
MAALGRECIMGDHNVTTKPADTCALIDGCGAKEIDVAVDTHARRIGGRNLPTRHLNQIELSRRWSLSPRTLEQWRWRGRGPRYLKILGRVVYRLEDIEAFEAERGREVKATRGATTPRRSPVK